MLTCLKKDTYADLCTLYLMVFRNHRVELEHLTSPSKFSYNFHEMCSRASLKNLSLFVMQVSDLFPVTSVAKPSNTSTTSPSIDDSTRERSRFNARGVVKSLVIPAHTVSTVTIGTSVAKWKA